MHIAPSIYSTGRQAYVGGSEAPSGNETLIGALRSNGLTLFLYLFTLVNSFASFHHIHPLSLPTLNQSSAFFSSDFSYFDLRFSAICSLIGAQWPWVWAFKQIGAHSGSAFKWHIARSNICLLVTGCWGNNKSSNKTSARLSPICSQQPVQLGLIFNLVEFSTWSNFQLGLIFNLI